MKFRKLGNSGLLVSELALGTMIFGEDSKRSTPEKAAVEIISAYIDHGGNHIDTANVYASGKSEEIVGKAIKGKRDKLVIATKVRGRIGDGPNEEGLSRYHIQRSVETSLKRLQIEHIDLLYMHTWDPLTPIQESLEAFNDLVKTGKVTYIGVSNFKTWQLMKSLGFSDQNGWARFVAAQYQYSLVSRDIEEEISELCEVEGVGIVPWGPLGGGFLTGKYQRGKPPKDPTEGRIAVTTSEAEEYWERRATEKNWNILKVIDEIAKDHNATHSQVALQWLLAQNAVSSIIIGVRTIEQLNDNMKAATYSLSPEEKSKLTKVSEIPIRYPARFIRTYGNRTT